VVESVTGILFVLAYRRFGFGSQLPFAMVLAGTVVAISGIDREHRRIPNVIVLPAAAVGLLSVLVTRSVPIRDALLGMAAGTLALGLLSAASKGGMGMGDAKLLGMVGAWTGWRGMLLTLFGASVIASVIGLVLIASRVIGRRQPIPFGPFLSLCGYAVYLYGDRMLELWLG
jgi:leader peptidase (prepilin peptidase)/N-methyltransferase